MPRPFRLKQGGGPVGAESWHPSRHRYRWILTMFVLTSALSIAAAAGHGRSLAWSEPHTSPDRGQPTDVQLTPDHDTYLSEASDEAQDESPRLRAGFEVESEYRAYLTFDVPSLEHSPERLLSAMLWLYPSDVSVVEPLRAPFQAGLLDAPLAPGAVYPPWPSSGDPTTEIEWTADTTSWKRIDVTPLVRASLSRDAAMSVEIAATSDDPALWFEFHSANSSDEDVVPRLILRYAGDPPSPTPSPTLGATATPTPHLSFVPWVEKP